MKINILIVLILTLIFYNISKKSDQRMNIFYIYKWFINYSKNINIDKSISFTCFKNLPKSNKNNLRITQK